MDDIYVNKDCLNKWVLKYFVGKEKISVGDLVSKIEDLADDVKELRDKIRRYEEDTEENHNFEEKFQKGMKGEYY